LWLLPKVAGLSISRQPIFINIFALSETRGELQVGKVERKRKIEKLSNRSMYVLNKEN